MPLEVSAVGHMPAHTHDGLNVSHGGLAFVSDHPMEPGQVVTLRMPTVKPPFEAKARVTWCKTEGARYCIGVQFLDADDAFQSRMVEQVCEIEQYRIDAMKKGRRLTTAEAAAEWIRKYADRFPG